MQLDPAPIGFPAPTLAFWTPQGYEWLIILAIAMLFFGKRLPGAARGIGQAIVEFKRGMKGAGQDGDGDASAGQIAGTSGPKGRFDPQTGKPLNGDPAATA